MRLLPPRHFTRSFTTNGKGTTSVVPTCATDDAASAAEVCFTMYATMICSANQFARRLEEDLSERLKPCSSICSSAQKQVPRLHAIIRERMIALCSE